MGGYGILHRSGFREGTETPVGEDDALSIECRAAKGTRVPGYALSPGASRV